MFRVTVALAEVPTEFVATSVNSVAGSCAAGVPEMTQVEGLMPRVAGKLDALAEPGLMPQPVTTATAPAVIPCSCSEPGVVALAKMGDVGGIDDHRARRLQHQDGGLDGRITSSTLFSFGSMSRMRARYASVSARAVSLPDCMRDLQLSQGGLLDSIGGAAEEPALRLRRWRGKARRAGGD